MENSNPLIFGAVAVIFLVILGYTFIAKAKRKSSSWTGTVIDKNVTETASNNTNQDDQNPSFSIGSRSAINRNYNLRIKDDLNNEFDWPVGSGFYETIVVGDRLTKNSGTETPTKL